MDISGKVVKKLQAQEGNGKNGAWKKQDFVIETEDKFPKMVCFSAWNERADDVAKLSIGTHVKVQFDVSSREFNEKWYTDLRAWKIEFAGSQDNFSDPVPSDDSYFAAGAPPISEDDLPF